MNFFFIHVLSLLYSNLSTFIENQFYRKKKTNSKLKELGFYKDQLRFRINPADSLEKKLSNGNFSEKLIIKSNYIEQVINDIFVKNNIKKNLFELTGFNYSIDFFLVYSTYNINEENLEKDIYANHWHRDKPFSKNTLKIIIPIDKIHANNGPMEILSIKDSSKINFFLDLKKMFFPNRFKLAGSVNDVFYFLPNLCYHKAGIPEVGQKRTQMMLQLNPSKKWRCSTNLYKKQYLLEPKFPILNFNDNHKLI